MNRRLIAVALALVLPLTARADHPRKDRQVVIEAEEARETLSDLSRLPACPDLPQVGSLDLCVADSWMLGRPME